MAEDTDAYLPLAVAWELTEPDAPMLHAVNGDAASLCENVPPSDLVLLQGESWPPRIPGVRCPRCALIAEAGH